MKKRVTCVLLVVLLLMVQVPSVFAATVDSGKCGDNLTWTLDDDGTLTISGTGSMMDFEGPKGMDLTMSTGSPWIGHRNEVIHVIIGEGVTNISRWAFAYCFNMISVSIPESVTSIEYRAFFNCSSLTNVSIPASISDIGMGAFESCHSLTNVSIPNGVSKISSYAFAYCKGLTNVTIPDSVTVIESYAFSAFQGEANLKHLYYGGSQKDWESIQIEMGNGNLNNATIHYNSSGSDNNPALEPVTPAPTTNNDISKYSFAFINNAPSFGYPVIYHFPLKIFQLVYGEQFANKMKEYDFRLGDWGGNCYGLATTAAMLARAGSNVTPSGFRDGATRPGELQVSDTNAELGLTLKEFIEAMQISQYSATFAATHKQNKDNLSGLLAAISAFESGGIGPLVICVHGYMNGGYGGHALLAYRLDGQRLYVYDCNYPNDGNRYITISESGWSYQMFDNLTWSNTNGGSIAFIPYETYLWEWYNRGHLLGDPDKLRQVLFFIDAADATITDSRGNEVATFQNGRMVSGIYDAYPVVRLGITADGVSAPSQIAVWLPYNNEYKVTSKENATISVISADLDVPVKSVAGGQTVSVSLSASPQFEDVSPGQYFYEPVTWAVGRGITNGTTPTTFSPQNTCSRNHILTFLWRANGSPAASVRNPFTDIDTSKDFGKAALWAYENGLVSGQQFNGGTPCSRADVVTYLWKLAGRPVAGGNKFSDVPPGAEYAAAVSWAVSRGITKGTSDTTFNPSGTCTRGQIVTFLHRAYADN
ncbi:MAG: leucine-rich repeat protein [Oscillospiraceae bacterium]|nr:leucine-rich repeat protein [Oscillospiraceae bacterium]